MERNKIQHENKSLIIGYMLVYAACNERHNKVIVISYKSSGFLAIVKNVFSLS